MKANRKLVNNDNAYNVAMVGGLVALLISIIIGVMVFWSLTGNIPGNDASRTEIFTGYTLPSGPAHTGGSNASAQVITLAYVPNGNSNSSVAVVCYNSTGHTISSPTVTVSGNKITIPAAVDHTATPPLGYNQVNVTYTPKIYTESTSTTSMANTVFALLPIIALVVVASIILAIVVGFGGSKGGNL